MDRLRDGGWMVDGNDGWRVDSRSLQKKGPGRIGGRRGKEWNPSGGQIGGLHRPGGETVETVEVDVPASHVTTSCDCGNFHSSIVEVVTPCHMISLF